MTSVKVRLYTYRATKNGTYPLVFQILHKREKKVVYSPYHLYKECFDEKKSEVLSRRRHRLSDADLINEYIHQQRRELRAVIEELEESEKDYSASDIAELYRSHQNSSIFFVYMRKWMSQLRESNRLGTLNAYRSTFSRVLRFTGGNEDLYFSDITSRWLARFIASLRKEGLKENTVNFYCRILRAVYNRAYNEGVPGTDSRSPFHKVSFGSVRTTKRAIDSDSLKRIVHADTRGDLQIDLARDLFLFSFYSRGMSFVDMACLRQENIRGDALYYKRRKTGGQLRVKIVPQLRQLIEKYRDGNEGGYILPILREGDKSLYRQYRSELRKFNNRLKKLSRDVGLDRPLTSYVARHSWATQLHDSGAPISVISQGLGHSSERVTYTYLAALSPHVIDSYSEKISDMYL